MSRLYEAIEEGVARLGDSALKERIEVLKATREQATADAEAPRLIDSSTNLVMAPDTFRQFARRAPSIARRG